MGFAGNQSVGRVQTVKEDVLIAVAGTKHYFGTDFLRPGQLVRLVKEPENPFDGEAIRVELMPLGRIGYVANSPHTVPRGCRSAGRIYDTFEEAIFAEILLVARDMAVARLVPQAETWRNIGMDAVHDAFQLSGSAWMPGR
ncbi:MAG: hypothetical protein BAA02_07725 [Paenibacillaceae bacterium ZCTH02-B3]|nr:MAG: hypothetical protein BAA02_07725 [Paenibacillaceae bacterium ZCTH02-B3]